MSRYVAWGVLFAFATTVIRDLNVDLFWHDEWWTLYLAGGEPYGRLSFVGVIHRIMDYLPWERNPPLYFLIVHGWAQIFGWSAFALRLLSLFSSLLALAIGYRVGKKIGTQHSGLGVMFLLALSPMFLHYAHEARVYALLMPLLLVLIYLHYKAITGQLHFLALVICVCALLYTSYVSILILGVLAIFTLLFYGKKSIRVLVALIIGSLLFLPWLLIYINASLTDPVEFVQPVSLINIISDLPTSLFSLPIFISLMWWRGVSKPYTRFLLLMTFSMIFAFVGTHIFWTPLPGVRQFAVLLPLIAIGVDWQVTFKIRRTIFMLILILVSGILWTRWHNFSLEAGNVSSISHVWLDDTKALLENCSSPDDLILINGTSSQYGWKTAHVLVLDHYLFPMNYDFLPLERWSLVNEPFDTYVSTLVYGRSRVWVISPPHSDPSITTPLVEELDTLEQFDKIEVEIDGTLQIIYVRQGESDCYPSQPIQDNIIFQETFSTGALNRWEVVSGYNRVSFSTKSDKNRVLTIPATDQVFKSILGRTEYLRFRDRLQLIHRTNFIPSVSEFSLQLDLCMLTNSPFREEFYLEYGDELRIFVDFDTLQIKVSDDDHVIAQAYTALDLEDCMRLQFAILENRLTVKINDDVVIGEDFEADDAEHISLIAPAYVSLTMDNIILVSYSKD
jgi:hypothetical protein